MVSPMPGQSSVRLRGQLLSKRSLLVADCPQTAIFANCGNNAAFTVGVAQADFYSAAANAAAFDFASARISSTGRKPRSSPSAATQSNRGMPKKPQSASR